MHDFVKKSYNKYKMNKHRMSLFIDIFVGSVLYNKLLI